MSADFDGYVADTLYPSYFHETHSPAWVDALLAREGWASPRQSSQDGEDRFTFLDLGCGDAVALALLAAAYPDAQFVGIDASADHIAKGNRAASSLDIDNLDLRCMTFAEAATNAPIDAQYIMSYGVMTWVTHSNRAQLLAAIDRHLSGNGVAIISYNCLPGWKDILSFQQLALRISNRMQGDGEDRFAQTVEAIRDLTSLGIRSIDERHVSFIDDKRKTMESGYFPHEYLNRGWMPAWSSDVVDMTRDAGLRFLRSAARSRWSEELYLEAAQREAIGRLDDPAERELTRDLFLDAWFRVDLFCRDRHDLEPIEAASLLDQTWLLCQPPDKVSYAVETGRLTVRFDNPAARAIADGLQIGPARLRDILARHTDMTEADILFACDCHVQAGNLIPVDAPREIGCDRVNAWVANSDSAQSRIDAVVTPRGVVALPAMEEGGSAVTKTLRNEDARRRLGLG